MEVNRESQITRDEQSILNTLSHKLELSREEVRCINYSIIPLQKFEIDDLIKQLVDGGFVFYSKKSLKLFVPDEVVWLLRDILGIELPNKYQRRILKSLKDSEINLVSKKHNIDRKLSRFDKIQEIINQGLSVTSLLSNDIFKEDTPKLDRGNRLQTLLTKDLELKLPKTGRSLEDKISVLIDYFQEFEKTDNTSLSKDGFQRLVDDLDNTSLKVNKKIKDEFEIQEDDVMNSDLLLSYNIQPRDIIYLLSQNELKDFCKKVEVSSRGNLVSNVIKKYRDIDDLFIENFDLIGKRDYKSLKELGLTVKESELGVVYENITKKIFTKLGFTVNTKLRNKLNTKNSKMDVLLDLGKNEVIVIECKTTKDGTYNKYSSVSRQLQSYVKLCIDKGYKVVQTLIVSNDFSDEFVSDSEYDKELLISLLTSKGLTTILSGFQESGKTDFPVNLFLKKGLLDENRIVKLL